MAVIPWLLDVLRNAGVQVVEEGDWRNRTAGGSFNPIGVLWHHTNGAMSSPSNPHPSLNICINGRSDLPGPLCHALVDYNGVFHLISANHANHAGTARASGPIPAGSGNYMLIGWEIDYVGDDPVRQDQAMSPAQYEASVKATAAVLQHMGKDASYARGHRETSTTGKIDPSFVNLDSMRADVAAAMGGGLNVGGQAYRYLDSQHVLGVGTNGNLINLLWSPATNKLVQDWGGGPLTGRPIGYVHNGQQHVFARGTNNTIRHWWQAGSGAPVMDHWGTEGRVMSNPTGFAYGDQQHLFYRNPDGNLEHKFWTASTNQITTGVWANGPFVGNPFAFVHKNQQHIFARGVDGSLKHWHWRPGADPAFDNWGITAGVASDPTGFSNGFQHHVLFRNTGGQLQHAYFDDPSGVVRGDIWPGGPFVGNPYAFVHKGQQHVFARKENGDLMHSYWPNADPVLTDNWNAVGVVTDDPIGLSTPDAHHVFYRIANGSMEHKFFVDTAGALNTDNWGGSLARS